MGWSGGSELADMMIDALHKEAKAPDKVRRKVYRKLIRYLMENDWDTQEDVIGLDPIFDKVLRQLDHSAFPEDE